LVGNRSRSTTSTEPARPATAAAAKSPATLAPTTTTRHRPGCTRPSQSGRCGEAEPLPGIDASTSGSRNRILPVLPAGASPTPGRYGHFSCCRRGGHRGGHIGDVGEPDGSVCGVDERHGPSDPHRLATPDLGRGSVAERVDGGLSDEVMSGRTSSGVAVFVGDGFERVVVAAPCQCT
jgi:hypothetical protein